jgi:two-component system, chemotaxis family, response regulator PixH
LGIIKSKSVTSDKNSIYLSGITKMSKILVVDDMPAELELMCQYLTQAGHTILTASNGEEALNQAKVNLPDVIVTDWMMPVMGGLDLCRHLKKQPETASIPIVACTAKNREVDRMWAMKQGVKVYLMKPYTAEDLVNAVREVTG